MRRSSVIVCLFLTSAMTLVACQPAYPISESPARPAVMPGVTPAFASTPAQRESGVRLTAHIGPRCADDARTTDRCGQPYAGEFVVTALNGAEVTRVTTDQAGQATVNLPPGEYLLGVRTEAIYPLAAPVKVNVLADRYAFISFRLDSGK
jgi:hypothetical protein